MVAPLQGIDVVEVANWIAVPGAGALLADMGARVIKVEPLRGDAMRNLVRRPAVDDERKEIDTAFQLDNRGKRSVAVDLDSPDGQSLVHKLIDRADVLTTNLIPERQLRYRLDPASLHEKRPNLIHVSLTAFGHAGEEANRTGFDVMAFFARSGTSDILTTGGDAPPRWRTGQGDHVTALNLALAILAALRMRDQTGAGQVVEASLLQTGAWSLASDYACALIDHKQPPRLTQGDAQNVLYRPWRCKDGRWILLMMLNPKPYWPSFCHAVGRPEWVEDPRFARFADRVRHREILDPQIEALMASRALAEWGPILDRHGLMWAPIASLEEAIHDPQLHANDAFGEIEHPRYGRFATVSAPFKIRDADIAIRGRAPDVGEHTEPVLRSLGLADDEVTHLVERGVIGVRRSE